MSNLIIGTILLAIIKIKLDFLPNSYLLASIFVFIMLDFITGVLKSYVQNIDRTSKGYRETFGKYIQYIGGLSLSVFLSFLVQEVPSLNNISGMSSLINNTIVIGINLIEILSICENLYAIDKSSLFSKYIIKPILLLLTLNFKKMNLNNIDNISDNELFDKFSKIEITPELVNLGTDVLVKIIQRLFNHKNSINNTQNNKILELQKDIILIKNKLGMN